MKPYLQISIPPLLVFFAIVSGCGNSKDKVAATQVAAKVNSAEITVYQVNNALAKIPNVTPDVVQRVKREILDNLIDQQLARQKAIEQKLDRAPDVLQSLEAAKTEILARAYVARIAAVQPKPTPEEIKTYYSENPALFAQRRVYSIDEISLPAQAGLAALLREQTSTARSPQDIAAWLKSKNIQFTANSGVRAAEQLPLEYLEKMQAMKNGDSQVFELRSGIQVIRVVASKPAPVNEASAAPKIHQFLFNQRSNVAVSTDMKRVKEQAKIEYVGEFAVTAAEAEMMAKAQLEVRAKADAEAKVKTDAASIEKAQARAKADVEAQDRADAITKARTEAEQARRTAESKAPSSTQKQMPTEIIEKGVRGL
jgi:EpsD family peptidyl-prolyl cis-trans isomerase